MQSISIPHGSFKFSLILMLHGFMLTNCTHRLFLYDLMVGNSNVIQTYDRDLRTNCPYNQDHGAWEERNNSFVDAIKDFKSTYPARYNPHYRLKQNDIIEISLWKYYLKSEDADVNRAIPAQNPKRRIEQCTLNFKVGKSMIVYGDVENGSIKFQVDLLKSKRISGMSFKIENELKIVDIELTDVTLNTYKDVFDLFNALLWEFDTGRSLPANRQYKECRKALIDIWVIPDIYLKPGDIVAVSLISRPAVHACCSPGQLKPRIIETNDYLVPVDAYGDIKLPLLGSQLDRRTYDDLGRVSIIADQNISSFKVWDRLEVLDKMVDLLSLQDILNTGPPLPFRMHDGSNISTSIQDLNYAYQLSLANDNIKVTLFDNDSRELPRITGETIKEIVHRASMNLYGTGYNRGGNYYVVIIPKFNGRYASFEGAGRINILPLVPFYLDQDQNAIVLPGDHIVVTKKKPHVKPPALNKL